MAFPGLNAEEKFTDLMISSFLKLSIISIIFHGHRQSGILQSPSNILFLSAVVVKKEQIS